MTKEEELGLNKSKKKFDIREEYYVSCRCAVTVPNVLLSDFCQRLQAKVDDDWESKRIERPKGVADWGVPPVEKEN